MKVYKLIAVTALMLIGCKEEPYTKLAQDGIDKTVMISVGIEVTAANGKVRKGIIRGAGVLISPNNHVLTCAHLFEPEEIKFIEVCTERECSGATLLKRDDRKDLALLQAAFDTPTPYATIEDPRNLKVGQEVIAVGNPLGLPFTVSHGIISALFRDRGDFYNAIQSDVMINPGNSGGPLFGMNGKLVGINSRIAVTNPFFPSSIGIAFSVDPSQIIIFLTDVRKSYSDLPKLDLKYWRNRYGI